MRLECLTELRDREWDAAVQAVGAPFRFSHRAAAGRAFESAYPSYRFTPFRADYSDGAALLVPLVRVTRRLEAMSMVLGMPSGLEGTPLAVAGVPDAQHLAELFGALAPCGQLVLSGGAGGSPAATGTVTSSFTHTLDLQRGFQEIWEKSFTAKTRNMCRKATRSGIHVVCDSTPEAASAYYELYADTARGWGYSVAPLPRALFLALIGQPCAELWLAHAGERPVAGAVVLRGSADLLYWSGASDRDYRRLGPGNAVIGAIIESACDRGVSYFDFGPSGGLAGVEAFKRSFGAQSRRYTNTTLSSWGARAFERLRHGLGWPRRELARSR